MGNQATKVFTASGTFTPPAGVTSIEAIVDYPSQAVDLNQWQGAWGNMFLIDQNKNMWAWGQGGQIGNGGPGMLLGTGTNLPVSSPVLVSVPGTKWRQVYNIDFSASALDEYGNCYTWGLLPNGSGGHNADSESTSSPVAVVGSARFSKIIDGSFGDNTVMALTPDGNLWAWGNNPNGELGVGDTVNRSSPTLVLGAKTWASVVLAANTSLGLDTSGNAWSWGTNITGELGVGDRNSRSSPVAVLGSHTFTQVIGGFYAANFFVALDGTGKAWAWGGNGGGNLGTGDTVSRSSPVAVVGGISFASLIKGCNQSFGGCGGVDLSGNIWLWGDNIAGQLGANLSPSTTGVSSPVKVVGGTSFAVLFAAPSKTSSKNTMFGLDVSGNLWAWGSNANGMLGANLNPGSTVAVSSPVAVAGGHTFTWMWSTYGSDGSSSGVTAYAVDQYGQLYSWGFNALGGCGTGNNADISSPTLVAGPIRPMGVNLPGTRTKISVTPGVSYAVSLTWATRFGTTIIGYNAKQVTIAYQQ
jgi:alpha-tubulin suppressor-like RCC1 family protein